MTMVAQAPREQPPEKCKDCKGKGNIVVKETYGDGDTCLVAHECLTCNGTGLKPGADGSEDFNIEDDDNDN